MNTSRKLVDQYRRKAEQETARRIEAERRLRNYIDQLDKPQIELNAKLDSVLAEVRQELENAQRPPGWSNSMRG